MVCGGAGNKMRFKLSYNRTAQFKHFFPVTPTFMLLRVAHLTTLNRVGFIYSNYSVFQSFYGRSYAFRNVTTTATIGGVRAHMTKPIIK